MRGKLFVAVSLVAAGCGRLGFDASSPHGTGGDASSPAIDGAAPGDTLAPGGALAAYSFSELGGTTTADRTGNGNDLTAAVGSPALAASGHTGNGLTFTTSCDRFANPTPSAALTAVSTGFTLMSWVYPTAVPTGSESIVVSYYQNSPFFFPYGLESFDYVHSGLGSPDCYFSSPGPEIDIAGPSKLAANTWSHLACTFDGATLALYVDGVQVASKPAATTVVTTGTQPSLIVGCDYPTDQNHLGAVDDIRIYDRGLSPQEVVDAMNAAVAQ